MTSKIDMSYNRAGGPQIDGNLAWEVGTERGPVTFADGKTVDFGVLSTNIYQKIDGRWLMISHQPVKYQNSLLSAIGRGSAPLRPPLARPGQGEAGAHLTHAIWECSGEWNPVEQRVRSV